MEPDRIYSETRERAATWTVRVAMALGLVGLVAILSMEKPEEKRIDRVVMRSLTVTSDGVCFLRNQATPFTGVVVDYHANGQLKSHTVYRDGLVDGEPIEFPDEEAMVRLDLHNRTNARNQPGT